MDPIIIVMVAVLALFVFVQFRSTKKRRAEQEDLNAKMVPGAEIMTQFGVFGTLLSVDEDKNEALIETTPGTVIRLHRQTILKVVESETPAHEETLVDEGPLSTDDTTEPGTPSNGKSDS